MAGRALADYLDLLEPRRGLAALPTPGTFYRPPAKYTTSRTAVASDTSAMRRVLQPTAAPSSDAGARNRAECVAFCANPANARECVPGGGGFCSDLVPGGAQGTPPAPLPVDPNLPEPVIPTCPEGSFWNGAACQVLPAAKSSAPMWIGLAVLAFAARRFLG